MKVEQTSVELHAVGNEIGTKKDQNSATTQNPQTTADDVSKSIENHDEWRIILYYCYVDLEERDVDGHVNFQCSLCEQNGLQGRIRVSTEGINGVLSGRVMACREYEVQLREELTRLAPPRNENAWELDVKYCNLRTDLPVHAQLFDSLICKPANCVVTLFEPGLTTDTHSNNSNDKNQTKYSKQTNRRQRRQQQRRNLDQDKNALDNNLRQLACQTASFPGAKHLSPQEWDQRLLQVQQDAVLLDCRNVYESNVGYFQVPQATTVLTNTRKYSDLPKILVQSKEQWANKKHIFMYCTGGVRCEQASKFVQAVVADQKEDVQVYQLRGGIQCYLDHHFHRGIQMETSRCDENSSISTSQSSSTPDAKSPCLFRGLNFVFDPRRTDPMGDSGTRVGKCCLCGTQHDDYDNGHAPVEEQEARCCRCRILVLVCSACRPKVQCWGEAGKEDLPKLYCGINACIDYQATGKNPVTIIGEIV